MLNKIDLLTPISAPLRALSGNKSTSEFLSDQLEWVSKRREKLTEKDYEQLLELVVNNTISDLYNLRPLFESLDLARFAEYPAEVCLDSQLQYQA